MLGFKAGVKAERESKEAERRGMLKAADMLKGKPFTAGSEHPDYYWNLSRALGAKEIRKAAEEL